MDKISIITPVYRVEEFLPHCIESVMAQTYQNWELLLIDDGSPDNSGLICDDFAAKDPRLRVYHKKNGGVSSARNFGLEEATGDWIMFVDSDDTIAPKTLEMCMHECAKHNLDILQFSLTRKEHDYYGLDVHKTEALSLIKYIDSQSYLICSGGSLIRSSIIKDHNIRFDIELRLGEDQIFIMECMRWAQKLKKLPDKLYYYRQQSESAIHNSKSVDMEKTALALSNFKKSHHVFYKKINKILLLLIADIIRNKDYSLKEVSNLYKKIDVEECSCAFRAGRMFFYMSKVSVYLAIILIKPFLK